MGKAYYEVDIDQGGQEKNWVSYAQNALYEIIKEVVTILKTSK